MNIGDSMTFFFDRNKRTQVVDVPCGEYLVEKYGPSAKDIYGYICLGKYHQQEKINHKGGNIYIRLGDGEEYCDYIALAYGATAKFFGHGCAKITRLS